MNRDGHGGLHRLIMDLVFIVSNQSMQQEKTANLSADPPLGLAPPLVVGYISRGDGVSRLSVKLLASSGIFGQNSGQNANTLVTCQSMTSTQRKTGRPLAIYKTRNGEQIVGLTRLGDGRWQCSGTGYRFTERDEDLAVVRFRRWQAMQQTGQVRVTIGTAADCARPTYPSMRREPTAPLRLPVFLTRCGAGYASRSLRGLRTWRKWSASSRSRIWPSCQSPSQARRWRQSARCT